MTFHKKKIVKSFQIKLKFLNKKLSKFSWSIHQKFPIKNNCQKSVTLFHYFSLKFSLQFTKIRIAENAFNQNKN
jgi:hypothetical protein